ncbi:hypothetical protein BP5796_12101 [Coleophoma crateriformis]|uniref:VOC domain-containing protein n=1 Tax=Coleophoma crateriformis TaxID=565419 RepID=A0A3D8QBU2_9HELO|nr:hypothetical protein BP5796_12101 [Coleophoma crateriformis]
MPVSHVSIPVSDIKKSTAFYKTLLDPFGYAVFKDMGSVVGFAPKYGNPDFWLHSSPEESKPASGSPNLTAHVAFDGTSEKAVQDWHRMALTAGATCNGPPGERHYVKGYYAAFVLDPDGNNIECLYFQPWWLVALQKAPLALSVLAVGAAWWVGKKGYII